MEASRRPQNYFQENFTFDPEISSFLSIDGTGLGKDCRGYGPGRGFCRMRTHGRWSGNIGAGEAAGLNCICARAVFGCGCAIAESGTGDHSGHSLGAAGAVARAWSGGKIERSECRDVDGLALTGLSGNSVRIAETSGLHL